MKKVVKNSVHKVTSFNVYLDENTNIGNQLKYYRKINGIRASAMAKELKIGTNTIARLENIENREYGFNHRSVQIINKIIDYLGVREKLNYASDEYFDFVINKQSNVIRYLVDKYGKDELSLEFDVVPDTISRWIDGNIIISRDNFYKVKKVLDIK